MNLEQKNKNDATKLGANWKGQPIGISPFVIGEFISKCGTVARNYQFHFQIPFAISIFSHENSLSIKDSFVRPQAKFVF